MEEDNIHRLEGTSNEKGGLIVKKKPSVFKIPQTSLLGLDRLAAAKRKEKEEAARKMSFSIDDEDGNDDENSSVHNEGKNRKFRTPNIETPTYTGGISEIARERLLKRLSSNKNKEKGVYATTKDSRRRDDYYNEKKHRRERDRNRTDQRSVYREQSPRFKDEPKTPNIQIKDVTAKTAWDDDDPVPIKKSSWDFPTPSLHKTGSDWSERSTKSRIYDESSRSNRSDFHDKNRKIRYEEGTPRATPAYKYNSWAKDRRKTGATPGTHRDNVDLKWDATVDRELWEEEQKRLDREWYNMDEGIHIWYFMYFCCVLIVIFVIL